MFAPDLPPYTPTVNPHLLPTEYKVDLSYPKSHGGSVKWHVYSLSDDTGLNVLLQLEAWTTDHLYISEALAYRATEYPTPAFRILPRGPGRIRQGAMEFETTIQGLTSAILEVPDQLKSEIVLKAKWGPRRFVFGGRNFVRRPLEPKDDDEGVFEFRTATPHEGSKTGKLDDDALDTCLFWTRAGKKARTWSFFAKARAGSAVEGVHVRGADDEAGGLGVGCDTVAVEVTTSDRGRSFWAGVGD